MVEAVHGSCRCESPNCLWLAIVNGEVFLPTPESMAASGVLTMYAASRVKQYWQKPDGSDIIIPHLAANFRGLRMKLRHS